MLACWCNHLVQQSRLPSLGHLAADSHTHQQALRAVQAPCQRLISLFDGLVPHQPDLSAWAEPFQSWRAAHLPLDHSAPYHPRPKS